MNAYEKIEKSLTPFEVTFTIKKGEWTTFMDEILDHVDDLKITYPNVTIRITEF